MPSAQVVTLNSGQQNTSLLTQNRLTQNRQCVHLIFVQLNATALLLRVVSKSEIEPQKRDNQN